MKALNLEGIISAVTVPMRQDYSVDIEAFRRYLAWVISASPVAVAVNTDAGEGPYLTRDERYEIIQVTREVTAGRCAIVAGIVGPSTLAATEEARSARAAGADALLIFPNPVFLNDPLDIRIPYDYHKAIADASDLPLIVFQLQPLLGGVIYPRDALLKLLQLPQVVGLKDGSFDARCFVNTRDIIRQADRPIALLTGNDNFMLESLLLGADGGLLGFGAVGTEFLVDMFKAVKAKDFDRATVIGARAQSFCDYIFGRPVADYRARCKAALVHMGLLQPDQTFVRPPLSSRWESEKDVARVAVEKAGLSAIPNNG
ncbi:MAG: 4-hydroxy-tetrahydrodipicolinate synthase [Nitrosomonadaceae bacterium]|nr:4-hydroxy-tetrahydrodipicolinate synthase [Nitrosomonadaceae bacterium]